VAGPARTDDHMSESVHRSAMEGADPNPEKRRDIIVKGFNPSFDHQKEASSVPPSSGDAAEAENLVKGAVINAKDAKEAAEKAKVDAEIKKSTDKQKAEKAAKEAKELP
jgi:hypothetical protein